MAIDMFGQTIVEKSEPNPSTGMLAHMVTHRNGQIDQLTALSLRYGGPDGSDWPKLLAWFQARVKESLSPDKRANREPETKVKFGQR